jgi:hypothetical protein
VGEWKLAMLALAPFLRGRQKQRTWVAMFGASVATYFVHDPVGFLAIDAIAAAIVVARPSGLPQKAIGGLFVWMMMFDLGFLLSPHAGWDLFFTLSTGLGWFQWMILAGWEGHDAWRRYRNWSDAVDRPPPAYEGRVR